MRRLFTVVLAVALTLPMSTGTTAADNHNCSDYPSQAAAQAALRANPSDPDGLDGPPGPESSGIAGVACESNPGPFDQTPVATAAPAALAEEGPQPPTPGPVGTVYWVRGYPQEGTSGCVEYVAQWSDGSYTWTPWDCPPGVIARTETATATRGYPQLSSYGCVEYVTQWSNGRYTWVPFECPLGIAYFKPLVEPEPTTAVEVTLPPTTPETGPVPIAPPEESDPVGPPPVAPPPPSGNCDPSYPSLCLPPSPDINCPEITARNFPVLPPDPHDLDRDHDGVGCEA